MIIRSLLNCSQSLLMTRSHLNPTLIYKLLPSTTASTTTSNVNLCRNVLSAQSVRFKLNDERAQAKYYREFKSTWLTRILPEDIDDVSACKMFRNLRTAIQSGEPRRTKRKSPIDYRAQMKGIVLKTIIKKPKKPNSANRKCVYLRLSNGKQKVAHVPFEGHNLQEHSMVLVQMKRTKDVPGLRLKCIRGKYDLGHVYKEGKK